MARLSVDEICFLYEDGKEQTRKALSSARRRVKDLEERVLNAAHGRRPTDVLRQLRAHNVEIRFAEEPSVQFDYTALVTRNGDKSLRAFREIYSLRENRAAHQASWEFSPGDSPRDQSVTNRTGYFCAYASEIARAIVNSPQTVADIKRLQAIIRGEQGK